MSRASAPISIIRVGDPLPGPESALGPDSPYPGLVAAGQDLSASRLIEAYQQGIFPWYSQGQPILWWSTDPRMVLPVSEFKLHRSFKKTLIKTISQGRLEIKIDQNFDEVVRLCAQSKRAGQVGTWIQPEMKVAYRDLHQQGKAHSVECWLDGNLVGGLYCVAIGKAVFGESMFSLQSEASKIALTALICFCRQHGIPSIDCQQQTPHLKFMGARPISRQVFLKDLKLFTPQPPPQWEFFPVYWNHILPFTQQMP
jgi:leucyl/phenylalanyl-tRNA--protein transferase